MIEPAFLDELARYDASLQRRVETVQQGQQRSTEVGEGLTFSDHRNYTPGDDTRLIDWRVYARTEELYVKQFEAERDLTVHVLVDASASMDFGGDRAESNTPHKFEYAAKLGLGFASLAAAEHNDFRVSLLSETFDRLDRARSSQGEVLRLVNAFNESDPEAETYFQRACEDYAATIDSKSLVLVVSDFLETPEEIEAGLGALARNDLILAHVVAPEERDPPARGDTIFRDPERGSKLRTYFGARVEREYRDRFEDHREEIEAVADRLGARYVTVDTGTDFFDSFGEVWVE
jgi:uncharacterized protein (DUF58 family)